MFSAAAACLARFHAGVQTGLEQRCCRAGRRWGCIQQQPQAEGGQAAAYKARHNPPAETVLKLKKGIIDVVKRNQQNHQPCAQAAAKGMNEDEAKAQDAHKLQAKQGEV